MLNQKLLLMETLFASVRAKAILNVPNAKKILQNCSHCHGEGNGHNHCLDAGNGHVRFANTRRQVVRGQNELSVPRVHQLCHTWTHVHLAFTIDYALGVVGVDARRSSRYRAHFVQRYRARFAVRPPTTRTTNKLKLSSCMLDRSMSGLQRATRLSTAFEIFSITR